MTWYWNHSYDTIVQWDLSPCICCRDSGLGGALEVRQVLFCAAFVSGVSVTSAEEPNENDLWPRGWVPGVFLGLFWLEVGEVGGVCLCCASLRATHHLMTFTVCVISQIT